MALEFTKIFNKGQLVTDDDIPIIMQCKNIDYGHVFWNIHFMFTHVFVNNVDFMIHLTNNIIDVSIHGNNKSTFHSFISGIVMRGNKTTLKYVINNRYVNKELITYIESKCMMSLYQQSMIGNLRKLLKYLNNTSSDKFTGYYNLEKYHYMIPIMLLVTKIQTVLPKCIIKHLIIPFIYR